MVKVLSTLFVLAYFSNSCFANGCCVWTQPQVIQPLPVVQVQPQYVVVYQPIVVQEVRLVPVVYQTVQVVQPVVPYNPWVRYRY